MPYPLSAVRSHISAVANLWLANLAAYWKFDNNALDSYGGQNLTAVNSPTYVTGKLSQAAQLASASSQYFSRSNPVLLSATGGATDWAFCCWVHLNSAPSSYTLVHKGTGTAAYEYWVFVDADVLRFRIDSNAASVSCSATSLLSNGNTAFCAVWFDHTLGKIYASVNNGTPTNANYSGAISDTGGNFYLGSRFGTGAYMDGWIDNAVFRRGSIFSAGELTQLYNSGNGLVLL